MPRPLLLSTAVFAAALALGCGDRAGVTDPAPGATSSLEAEISRFEQPLIIFFGSGGPDISALLGVTFEDFPALCAGAEPQVVANTMIVTHPTQQGGTSEHVLTTAKELSALVWPVDLGPGGDVCDLQGVQPFVGTVNVMINDNEGQFFETAPGGNAFSLRFVGTLTDPASGQRYHLQGGIHIVVLPDGTFKFLPTRFLQLTPIGG